METRGITLFLVVFLLLIATSFQDGNFTAFENLSVVASITGNIIVIATLEAAHQVTLSTQTSSSAGCPTSRALPNSVNSYQQRNVPSAGTSNTFVTRLRASLNSSSVQDEGSSPNNVAVEVTIHATNTSNATVAEQSHSNHLDLSREDPRSQRTQPDDDSPSGNDTSSQDDVADRWVALLRKSQAKKRKSQYLKDDVLSPKPTKPNRRRQLWTVGLAAGALLLATPELEKRRKRQKTQDKDQSPKEPSNEPRNIIAQLDASPKSPEQLVEEVKGIYVGLVAIEAKCIEVSTRAASGAPLILSNQQWQAIVALHRTLLNEHHDFFLASQHPSASAGLRQLASKCAMPARMWRHGIFNFLETMRLSLPSPSDHMLEFIYVAYSTMASLYETVPTFEDTWIECLGDLSRYRIAIEDSDFKAIEVWTDVATHWYTKASDKVPSAGRFYHRLAVLARPNALQQMFYYSKSLCVAEPFPRTRESILALFNSDFHIDPSDDDQPSIQPLSLAFVGACSPLFTNKDLEGFEHLLSEFTRSLENQCCNARIWFNDSPLIMAIKPLPEHSSVVEDLPLNNSSFQAARMMGNTTLEAVLRRLGDPNVLPCIHVSLAFMHCMAFYPLANELIPVDFPWESLAIFLNSLLDIYDAPFALMMSNTFPNREDQPLPEDVAMRGLLWAENYFPNGWFSGNIENESRAADIHSMTKDRTVRILWLAARLAEGFPCRLKYTPASYNPLYADFIKARFSIPPSLPSSDGLLWAEDYFPSDLFAANIEDENQAAELHSMVEARKPRIRWLAARIAGCSPMATKTSQSPCSLEDSSTPSSFVELERSLSYDILDENPLLNGINATLSLPIDPLEDLVGEFWDLSPEDPPYLTQNCPESLESWLLDLVNLDVTFNETQDETETDERVAVVAMNSIPCLSGVFSSDLLVLSQTGYSFEMRKDMDRNSNSNRGNDDQEQQDSEEEKQSPFTQSHTTQLTPCQADEELPSEPLAHFGGHKHPENIYPITAPALLPSPEASSPPSSPKPHNCPHCNKSFARVSVMNKHIKYHTKPISCQFQGCGYTCGRRRDLIRHQNGFHKEFFDEQEFFCSDEECKKKGVKFSRRDNLGRHLKRKHGKLRDESGGGEFELE